MLIGILQTGHAREGMVPGGGDLDQLFRDLLDGQDFAFRTWTVCDMVFPEGPEAADGWLITGSKHGVYEDLEWIPRLEALIRDIHAADRPLVGICFGHQIIAQALGGKVEKFAGGWSVGRSTYDWNGEEITLNAWHQDQVVAPPPGAERLASSTFCENAALVYGDRAFSVQAHPEFGRHVVETLIQVAGPGHVPEPDLERARDGLDRPVDNGRLAQMIGRFFRERRLA